MLKIYTNSKSSWRFPANWGIVMLIFLVSFIPGRVLSQDSKLINGTVSEAPGGLPIPGASVKVKGTQKATSTNADGKYSIQAKSTDVLVFSFLGSKSQEITVGSKTTIDVTLIGDVTSLNETVIIGYGSVQKKDLTSSVGQANVKEMAQAPVSSFAEALGGRVAGVTATISDGQPGGAVNIVIRGPGSLNYSTGPLYVVDGFPSDDFDPASLNPEEIASLSVLKDAASTAIYGARGANGVILIQTKRGAVGKPVINFNTSYGLQVDKKRMEMMSPYEFVKYVSELHPTQAYVKAYFEDGKTLESYRNVEGIDWQDQVFRKGNVLSNNIAIRGGTENTKYSISGSIFNQDGVILNTGLKRYNGRVNIDQNISNKFKTGLTANYSGINQFGSTISVSPAGTPSSFIFFRTWAYRPVASDDNFDLLTEPADDGSLNNSDYRINPVTDLENTYSPNRTGILNANAYLSYDITKDLVLKVAGGANINRENQDRFYNSNTTQGAPETRNPNNHDGVWGSVRGIYKDSWSNSNTLTYNKVINKDHAITALGLFEMSKYHTQTEGYSARLLPNEALGMDGLDQSNLAFNPDRSSSLHTIVSYGGRVNYSYKSKYLLSASLRADASSKFANPWGYFPSGSLAWNMDKEDFFIKAFPFVSSSKIRASFGSNGNNGISPFERFATLATTLDGYSYGNQTPTSAVYISAMENKDLRWERVEQMDLGYDLALFKNKVELTVDLYKKTTKDLLLSAKLPTSTGFTAATKNVGSLENRGLEITLNTTNISTKNFTWTSNFNISFNQNKILELSDGSTYLGSTAAFESQFDQFNYIHEVGQPSGMMMGLIWDGNYQYADFDNPSPGLYILKPSVVFNNDPGGRAKVQPGDIKYKDVDGDGVVTNADYVIVGRGQPIHTGGFINNFMYKGFSLSVFLQWSYGADIYNANRLSFEGNSNNRLNMNQFASYENRWSPENQTNENYRAGGVGPIGKVSSKVIEDGSFLRVKTVSLDYSIPKRYIKPLYLNNLSLNISAQNLFTFTKYTGLDPEVAVRNQTLTPNWDYSTYPQARTIVFGLKAEF